MILIKLINRRRSSRRTNDSTKQQNLQGGRDWYTVTLLTSRDSVGNLPWKRNLPKFVASFTTDLLFAKPMIVFLNVNRSYFGPQVVSADNDLGCFARCSKVLLIVFNIIFWLAGAGLVAVGLWIALDKKVSATLQISEDNTFRTAAYILIVVGGCVFFIAFSGCAGAMCENQTMLGIYIVFVVLIVITEITGGALYAVNKDELVTRLTMPLQEYIKSNSTDYRKLFDVLQTELSCCGADNSADYRDNALPSSCCKPPNKNCTVKVNSYTQGCIPALENLLTSHSNAIIGVAVGVAVLQLIVFIFATVLCCEIGKAEQRVLEAPKMALASAAAANLQAPLRSQSASEKTKQLPRQVPETMPTVPDTKPSETTGQNHLELRGSHNGSTVSDQESNEIPGIT